MRTHKLDNGIEIHLPGPPDDWEVEAIEERTPTFKLRPYVDQNAPTEIRSRVNTPCKLLS